MSEPSKEAIEREALRLYDRLNPDWKREIKVSKADCIKMARERLKRKAQHEST